MIAKLEFLNPSGSHEINTSDINRFLAATDTFVLKGSAEQSMICHLRACLPREGAGLISIALTDDELVGDEFYACRNTDTSRTRYTMDPDDVATALRHMEIRGSRLAAIVHAHPRTPPIPSKFDLAEATPLGAVHLIVGFVPTIAIRAWRLMFDDWGTARNAVELRYAIASENPGRSEEPSPFRNADEMVSYDRTERWTWM